MTLAVDTALLREPNLWVPKKAPIGRVRLRPSVGFSWDHYMLFQKQPWDYAKNKTPVFESQNGSEGGSEWGPYWGECHSLVEDDIAEWSLTDAVWWMIVFKGNPSGNDCRPLLGGSANNRHGWQHGTRMANWFKVGGTTYYNIRTDAGSSEIRNAFDRTQLSSQLFYIDIASGHYGHALNGKGARFETTFSSPGLVSSNTNKMIPFFDRRAAELYMVAKGRGRLTLDQMKSFSADPYQFLEPA